MTTCYSAGDFYSILQVLRFDIVDVFRSNLFLKKLVVVKNSVRAKADAKQLNQLKPDLKSADCKFFNRENAFCLSIPPQ
ncbi:MAG TPA: hypothetical protein PKJ75_03060 [Methanosarcina vacuolata]|nr:hypothetical protein [Methanosarcina vacuolata]HPS89333.1 hypothetical protein [Methanosarcina vacuolata]